MGTLAGARPVLLRSLSVPERGRGGPSPPTGALVPSAGARRPWYASVARWILGYMGAEVRETHTGVVVLVGDRAYKAKKPVVTDFLDFGTPELRERACRRELDLNRRLAPDVYLGMSRLTDPLDGPDEPILVMRRMPEEARLASRVAAGTVTAAELSALAGDLLRFHRHAERGPLIDRAGHPDALRRRWRILVQSLTEQPAGTVDQERLALIDRLATRFIDGRAPLLHARITQGHIVDGHGDLLAEDIFAVPGGFRILDCLDFDDALRYVDCLDDAAFLAMDLEFLGAGKWGEHFLDTYLTQADDTPPRSLRHHYIAYRALVRAKTDRMRASQGDRTAGAHAREHVDLAADHLVRGAVRLALVGGLPGTGKSTVAARLAARTGAELLSSDTLRMRLRRSGMLSGGTDRFGEGVYRPEAKARVYEQLLEIAQVHLVRGRSVVLDAGWLEQTHREHAAAMARRTYTDMIELRCDCPRDVAARRLRDRPHTNSDATPEIALALAETRSPWPEAVELDTTEPITATTELAEHHWNKAPLGLIETGTTP